MSRDATPADVLAGAARWCVVEGDALALLASLPDASVNLAWIDPPYYRVVAEAWDRAWPSETEYLRWLRGIVAELARVLAPNGSLYLFASPEMAARVEVATAECLRVLNAVTWAKPETPNAGKYGPENFRRWVQMSERVVFAERRGRFGGGVLGDEIRGARESAGLTRDQLDVAIGRTLRRDPSKGSGLIRLQELGERTPSAEDFAAALRACGDDRAASELQTEYLRLLRPFAAPASFTDVWTYASAPAVPGRHPCEKPAAMLRDVVLASSREGDVVLDLFGGSHRMGEVALSEGRRYLAADSDPHWAAVGTERCRAVVNGTAPVVPARAAAPAPAADPRQRSLFDLLAEGAR